MHLSAFGVEDSRISKADDDDRKHHGALIGSGIAAAGLAGGALLAHDKIPGLRALKTPFQPKGMADMRAAARTAAGPSGTPFTPAVPKPPAGRPGAWNFDALPKKPGPKVLKPMAPPAATPAPGKWDFNKLPKPGGTPPTAPKAPAAATPRLKPVAAAPTGPKPANTGDLNTGYKPVFRPAA